MAFNQGVYSDLELYHTQQNVCLNCTTPNKMFAALFYWVHRDERLLILVHLSFNQCTLSAIEGNRSILMA